MKSPSRTYFLQLLVFTLVVVIITAVAWFIAPAKYISPTLPAFPVFFFLVTFLVHRSLIGRIKSGTGFIQQYMIVTVGKLLLFMAILLIYAFTQTHDALAFTVAFLVYYLLFSGFEVVSMLKANERA